MESEPDPQQLASFAAITTGTDARIAALDEVESAAADADPAPLPRPATPGTSWPRAVRFAPASPERAADTLWTLADPRTYRALAIHRGWTDEEYQHWLADLLASALWTPDQRQCPAAHR